MDSAFCHKTKEKHKKLIRFSNNKLESVLFSKGKRTNNFFTNDSYLYFACDDCNSAKIIEFRKGNKWFDSLNHKVVKEYVKIRSNKNDYLYIQYQLLSEKLKKYQEEIENKKSSLVSSLSILKLWNASIMGAVIIGMVSMSFIYRYLGPGVLANDIISSDQTEISYDSSDGNEWTEEKENQFLTEMAEELKSEADNDFYLRAEALVAGYPIEKMMPYIKEKDPQVAAFLIAIAKKESNWGKRVPVLNGEDCYNYWGFRGVRERMGTGGHTCFDSREEAVEIVAKRINDLIKKYDRDTAEEMVVWKCGSNCAVTGGQAAANKWIEDVDMYLRKLNEN